MFLFRNRHLINYPNERIVEYINSLSEDIQKNVERSITDPAVKETLKLASLMNSISEKTHELPLVIKLKAEQESIPDALKTHGVNFT